MNTSVKIKNAAPVTKVVYDAVNNVHHIVIHSHSIDRTNGGFKRLSHIASFSVGGKPCSYAKFMKAIS